MDRTPRARREGLASGAMLYRARVFLGPNDEVNPIVDALLRRPLHRMASGALVQALAPCSARVTRTTVPPADRAVGVRIRLEP